jgi:glyoxylase-like metal-dependent hydrolase (beta-lactamase superfamily II)
MRPPVGWIGGTLAAALLAAGPVAITGAPRPEADYQVYAIRYATLPAFPTRALVAGADSARRSEVAMTVWLLQGPERRTVLVDAGFYRDEFIQRWRPAGFRRPSEVLDSIGVPPESVTDIIVTHVHWDHLDGADLFPNARVWIQREEYDYHVGPGGEALQPVIAPADAAMLKRLGDAGRLQLVDGDDREIIPGIRVFTGGRHTWASQYAAVRTRSGTVVIASDNVYLYENIDRHVPIAATLDSAANLAAQDRMLRMVSRKDLLIPGHDPAVFQRFPTEGRDVARID